MAAKFDPILGTMREADPSAKALADLLEDAATAAPADMARVRSSVSGDRLLTSEVGVSVAPLVSGQVPAQYLAHVQQSPAGGPFLGSVANQAAMLALTATVAPSWCIRSDTGQTFDLTALPASTLANWVARSDASSLGGRVTDLEASGAFMPGANALLRAIKVLRLFGADLTKYYFVRYFFKNDSGTRFNLTISSSTSPAGTSPTDVCAFSSAGTDYGVTATTEFTLVQLASSGVTASVVIDFSANAATFGVYAVATTTRLRPSALAETAEGIVKDNARAAVYAFKRPFADEQAIEPLRKWIKRLWLYNCKPGRTYRIRAVETSATRVQLVICDDLGADHVYLNIQPGGTIAYGSLAPAMMLAQGNMTNAAYKGGMGYAEFDWTQLPTSALTTYTTRAQGGIHPDHCRLDSYVDPYLSAPSASTVVTCAPTGADHSTLRAALTAVTAAGYDAQRQVRIAAGTYQATLLDVTAYTEMAGAGIGSTIIAPETTATDELLRMPLDGHVHDLTILSNTGDGASWGGEYCLHSDDFNRKSAAGYGRRIRQRFSRVRFIGGPLQDAWLFGCGVSNGERIRFEECEASHTKPVLTPALGTAAFGFHNTALSACDLDGSVEMVGCFSTDTQVPGVLLQSLGATNKTTLALAGCNFHFIKHEVASNSARWPDLAADRYEWVIAGRHHGAVLMVDLYMFVLQTTAGAAVSGTAAALIFGVVDELGRGNKLIHNGTPVSLGARLGDCSTVNKTLTIGAQTCTFTTNLTAATNTAVLAIINAALTENPVSEVRIDSEIYPDIGTKRRVTNATGAVIAKGRYVKLTTGGGVAYCQPGDRIDAFTYRAIMPGVTADVVDARCPHHVAYTLGLGTDGEFGLLADGVPSPSAATKVGRVRDAVVSLY